MTPPLLSVKLRNQLRKLNPALEVELKNININGMKRGCSGYITDPRTGRVIYVDTEALLQPILGGRYVARSRRQGPKLHARR